MVSTSEMTSWFPQKYDRATESLFYDSREGGFQYPPGSHPIDIRSVLEENFPKATQTSIDEAVHELEDDGPWVNMKDFDEAIR